MRPEGGKWPFEYSTRPGPLGEAAGAAGEAHGVAVDAATAGTRHSADLTRRGNRRQRAAAHVDQTELVGG